jgi:hypothetical protein
MVPFPLSLSLSLTLFLLSFTYFHTHSSSLLILHRDPHTETSYDAKDFFGPSFRQFWRSQFVTYLLTPNGNGFLQADIFSFLAKHAPFRSIPRPFISIHVRYGDKHIETKRMPLDAYVKAFCIIRDTLGQKRADWKSMRLLLDPSAPSSLSSSSSSVSVFLSTETESVLESLPRNFRVAFPQNQSVPTIYTLYYPRIEELSPKIGSQFDLVPSLANLYIALHADGFVGTFSSNWCRLLWDLEMTRGDGGSPYISVDEVDHYVY